jgi:hypothetical protein
VLWAPYGELIFSFTTNYLAMKNIILIISLIISIILIFFSQKTFYSGPVKTVYKYDGDYVVGGDRFDKNDRKLESFYINSELKNGKLVTKEVITKHYTFWGKARKIVFVLSIICAALLMITLFLSNKKKILNK